MAIDWNKVLGTDNEKDLFATPAPLPFTPDPAAAPAHSGLADAYGVRAQDNSDIDAAKADADSKNSTLGVIQGLATAFGGGNKNESFYNSLRAGNDSDVKMAQDRKKASLDALLAQDKLAYEPTVRQQAAEKHQWEGVEKSPGDASANSMSLYLQTKGVKPELLKNMSFDQQKDIYKEIVAEEKAKNIGAAGTSFLTRAIEDPNGGPTTYATFNRKTGEWSGTSNIVGTPRGYDSPTGQLISRSNPAAPAVPVRAADGTPLAAIRTGLEGDRAHAHTTGANQAKDENQLQDAVAAHDVLQGRAENWMKLRDQAEKEGSFGIGGVGPLGGRIANIANSVGVSYSPAADSLRSDILANVNDYVHQKTGAVMTEGETSRILGTLPLITQDKDLFAANVQRVMQEADRIVAERQAKAASIKAPGSAAPAVGQTPPSPPPAGTVPMITPDGKKYNVPANQVETAKARGWK